MTLNSVRLLFTLNKPSFGTLQNNMKRFASAALNKYQYILIDKKGEKQNVGLITLNRPNAFNALCIDLIRELAHAINAMDKDESVRAILLTGSDKAFAAGADLKEMLNLTYSQITKDDIVKEWNEITKCKKPLIAAVSGCVFGGGCELAMMCDIIYAGDKARFALAEVTVGTNPGAGGTQRTTRICGKSKGMELLLSGDKFDAREAEKIAFHTTLQEGLRFEKTTCYATFSTEDRKEGMSAFVEKRKPNYKNN